MATTQPPFMNEDLTHSSFQNELPVNLGWPERIISVTVGSRMLSRGIRKIIRHPVRNTILSMAGGYLLYRGLTGNCPLYSSLGKSTKKDVNINIKSTLLVNKPRQEVYTFWRELENLPLFMEHLASVKNINSKRSSWEAKLPGNVAKLHWEAEIINDEPGKLISWRSIHNSTIGNEGKVEFSDLTDGQGTKVTVLISYLPPGGGLGTGIAKLLNPMFRKMVEKDVHNFKEFIESVRTEPKTEGFIET